MSSQISAVGDGRAPERRPDLDWLRVAATAVVLLFHSARFFDDEQWHVKNSALSYGMTVFVWFASRWMMPLFFVLSACSVYYALAKRTAGKFLKERVSRLLVPLAFGIIVLIPPQVYVERVSHGQFAGSFLEFFPKYFDGLYGFGGNFAWMGLHLWYLEALFLFSALALPLFVWARSESGAAAIGRLSARLAKPGVVYLFVVPVTLTEIAANTHRDGIGMRDFGGWSLLTYLAVFMVGYLVAAGGRRLGDAVVRQRFVSLGLAAAALTIGYLIDQPIGAAALSLLRACMMIFSLLAMFGFASRHLTSQPRWLGKANELVLPFYILHQSVIVVIAYFLIGWDASVGLKYPALVLASLAAITMLIALIIQPFSAMRFLFGIKKAGKKRP